MTLSRLSSGRVLHVLLLAAALTLTPAREAHAYLDPGTGSFIFQIVVATVCGAGFAIKMFWSRICARFTRSSRSDSDRKP